MLVMRHDTVSSLAPHKYELTLQTNPALFRFTPSYRLLVCTRACPASPPRTQANHVTLSTPNTLVHSRQALCLYSFKLFHPDTRRFVLSNSRTATSIHHAHRHRMHCLEV